MRVILGLSLLLSVAAYTVDLAFASGTQSSPGSNSASADSDKLDAASMKNLVLLEKKYFEHTFDSDTIENRVERIEQLILGDATKGNPQDRLNKMVNALTADGESLEPVNNNAASSANNSNKPAPNKQVASRPAAQDGRDLTNDPYANDRDEDPAAGQTSNYPHVTNLEKQILGTTYDGQPLNSRLARLETKAFGTVSQLPDLSQRTDALERYAETKLSKKPFAGVESPDLAAAEFEAASGNSPNYPRNYSGAPQQAPQRTGSQLPRQVLQSLLGIPTFGPPPRAQNSSYESYDQPAAPQDDPRVFQQDPPPPGEQMLVRVGWCEVHTFGHTYLGMHLTQRLRQLNDAVRPGAPKQNDMQLMDDLDKIVAAVQARHPHPDKAIGAKNAGMTQ
ncbi:MAG: hypothetical protein K2X77_22935 [Candidatus Obscuribacterales bacterium]|jgi:hypothetical protein|nr:hypothetical protein [Candidatus Obscuribacterales bacterium]